MLVPSLTAAQTNWALLPGPDSLVATPLGHLREVAAFRIVRDVQVSKYRAETIERVNAAVNWQNALSKSDSIAKVKTERLDLCDERLTIVQKQADKSEKKNKRLKTSLTVVFAVAVLEGIIIAVK